MPLDLERPVDILIKPTIVGHERAFFSNWSVAENETWNQSLSQSSSETLTEGDSENTSDTDSITDGWNNAQTLAGSTTLSYTDFGPLAQPVGAAIGTSTGTSSGTSGAKGSASSRGKASSRSASTSTGMIESEAYSHGRSESYGASEGLEPIYEDLPTAVHSYQNALYFAAQMLRSLTAGEAFASFVDDAGMHHARLRVPLVRAVPISDKTLNAIRMLLFSRSPSALETAAAIAVLEEREQKLFSDAERLQMPEQELEPRAFRVSGERWTNNPHRKGGKRPEQELTDTPCKEGEPHGR